MNNFCYFSNFKFGGTLLTQIMPNFCRSHTFRFTKCSNFLENHSFLTVILHCGLRNCSFFIRFIYLPYFLETFYFPFLFGLLYPFSILKFFSFFFFNLLLFFHFYFNSFFSNSFSILFFSNSFSILFQFYCGHILDFFYKPKF